MGNVRFPPIADGWLLGDETWMRTAFATLLLVLAGSCSKPAQINQIYIRESGEIAIDITVNSHGEGRFEISDYPRHRRGSFNWSPTQFRELQHRLEPFQRKSVGFTVASAESFIMQGCGKDVPFIYDVGAIYIRWTGPGIDKHYLANLGCDYKRNASRNSELLSIVKTIPVPRISSQ